MKTSLERDDEKMKRKNGFTLIELLAVIVILAIIALIAVPVVMNIIGKANKSAFKDSAYGILKAGELFYTDQLLENAGLMLDKTFNFPDDIDGLEFKGSKPSKGYMTVNSKGQVSMEITNGKYCVTKGFEDEDVQIKEDDGNCGLSSGGNTSNKLLELATEKEFTKADGSAYDEPLVTIPECATSGVCEPGTAFAIKVNDTETYKFYVLSDTGKEVTLIMDRNLGESVEWINTEDYGDSTVKNDKGPLTALRVLKDRTSGWTNIPEYSYTLKNDKTPEDGEYTYSDITGDLVTAVRARLPKFSELNASMIVDVYGVPSILPSWLYDNLYSTGDTNGHDYWTSTA